MRPRVLARLLQIQRALVRHGLDDFVRATHLYRPFRFLVYLSPWTWFQRSIGVTRGENVSVKYELFENANGSVLELKTPAGQPAQMGGITVTKEELKMIAPPATRQITYRRIE